jgi:hypothetical protein
MEHELTGEDAITFSQYSRLGCTITEIGLASLQTSDYDDCSFLTAAAHIFLYSSLDASNHTARQHLREGWHLTYPNLVHTRRFVWYGFVGC